MSHRPVAEQAPAPNPSQRLAAAAGYSDHEGWWNQTIEQRQDSADLFPAILQLMIALREDAERLPDDRPAPIRHWEAQREAHMRRALRQARDTGYQRIAVVCGAWHTPALRNLGDAAADDALLADLPALPVAATWVPWTYRRLSAFLYSAGVRSPGWYHHLWEASAVGAGPVEIGIGWLSRAGRLLREAGYDASPAQIIDAVRLAESIAALRGSPLPGLDEYRDALQAVVCGGDPTPMGLIERQLTISNRLGQVPDSTPNTPLVRDLARRQEALDLLPVPDAVDLLLDLRQPRDLARSHLLHRLALLGVSWGQRIGIGDAGGYAERWTLFWQPDFAVQLIRAGMWGATIATAAAARAAEAAESVDNLDELARLLDHIMLADLGEAVAAVLARLEEVAVRKGEVHQLLALLVPLANVLRYGSARRLDVAAVRRVVDGLVRRICVRLPTACGGLTDETAARMSDRLGQVQVILKMLDQADYLQPWFRVLQRLLDAPRLHPLLAGRVCRLLLQEGQLDPSAAARRMRAFLEGADDPATAAHWLEGFLQGSSLLLLHDDRIWQLLDDWVGALSEEAFLRLLPVLRRTFSRFSEAEKRQFGERAGQARGAAGGQPAGRTLDAARGAAALPAVARLLGLDPRSLEGNHD